MKNKKPILPPEVPSGRSDHEAILFNGVMIPILGTVGGSEEESRQTAENIDRFIRSNPPPEGASPN